MPEQTATVEPTTEGEALNEAELERIDALALVLVRQDAASKERETFRDKWERWRKLYIAEAEVVKDRENLNNIFDPVLFEIAQTQIPRLMQAWFGQKPLFPARGRGEEDMEGARQLSEFLQSQIDSNLLNPMTSPWVEVDGGVMQYLHYGTMVMQVSWDPERQRPLLECGDLHDYLFDPAAVRGYPMRYAIRQRKRTIGWIKQQTIPTVEGEPAFYDKDVVDRFLEGSAITGESQGADQETDENPDRLIENVPDDDRKEALSQSLRDRARDDKLVNVLEYWEGDRLIHVLDQRAVAHDGPNPHDLKEVPIWVVPLVPLVGRLYGIGNAEIGEIMQYEVNAKANQSLDNVDLLLNAPILKRRHSSLLTEEMKFEPGREWLVDDVDNDVKVMHLPNYLLGTMQEREGGRTRLNQSLGTTDYTKGQQGSDRVGVVIRLLIEQANARYGMLAQRFFEYGIRNYFRWSLALNLQFLGGISDSLEWEKVMGEDTPNPFKLVAEADGTVEDLMYDLAMPATYYTGSKALRAEVFEKVISLAYSQEPLAAQLNPRAVLEEMFRMNDVGGYEALFAQQQVGEEEQVAQENSRLMLGELMAPAEGEDHALHIQGHTTAMVALDPQMDAMEPTLREAIEAAFTVHLQGHRVLMDQEEAGQTSQEAGTPGPEPGPPDMGAHSRESAPVMEMERAASGGSPVEEGL